MVQHKRLACLTWSSAIGFDDIARLGAETAIDFSQGRQNWPTPLRYLWAFTAMTAVLLVRRPRIVVVTNPPIFAAVQAVLYGKISGADVVLDSHPGAFGLRERRWRIFVGLHRRLVPHASAVLVTTDSLRERVDAWDGRGVVMHEAPPPWVGDVLSEVKSRDESPLVLFPTIFDPDEPVELMRRLAEVTPHVQFRMTGALDRAPDGFADTLPSNLQLTGWLEQSEFRRLLAASDVVVVLTTDDQSVPRSAMEAIFAETPVVVTDTDATRKHLPHAVRTMNDERSASGALISALSMVGTRDGAVEKARDAQVDAWLGQLSALDRALGGRLGPDLLARAESHARAAFR